MTWGPMFVCLRTESAFDVQELWFTSEELGWERVDFYHVMPDLSHDAHGRVRLAYNDECLLALVNRSSRFRGPDYDPVLGWSAMVETDTLAPERCEVLRSWDGGRTWEYAGPIGASMNPFNPSYGEILETTETGLILRHRSGYGTTIGGLTALPNGTFIALAKTRNFEIHDTIPTIGFNGTLGWGVDVLRSTDNGSSWQTVSTLAALDSGYVYLPNWPDPEHDVYNTRRNIVFAGSATYAFDRGEGTRLYRGDANGENWEYVSQVYEYSSPYTDTHLFAVDDLVIVGGVTHTIPGRNRVSIDGGLTWTTQDAGSYNSFGMFNGALTRAPSGSGLIYQSNDWRSGGVPTWTGVGFSRENAMLVSDVAGEQMTVMAAVDDLGSGVYGERARGYLYTGSGWQRVWEEENVPDYYEAATWDVAGVYGFGGHAFWW